LGLCLERGVRIVSNAGGLNPKACAEAIEAVAARLGLTASVGYVEGDDLLTRLDDLSAMGRLRSFESGRPLSLFELTPTCANAYLGGWGIVSCLRRGADVVVTGRVTDAALTIGPAAWHFGWAENDWDQLAGGLVAGHVIECGGQATGGNFSFFSDVPHPERISFPIAEVAADGSTVITKAPGLGGFVTVDTVTAQLLYEVGGPQYLNPDVTARLDTALLEQVAPDRVRISGVRGEPPPPDLKVSMAVHGGFRNDMILCLTGRRIEEKATYAERAVWEVVPGGRAAFDDVVVEVLGRTVEDPSSMGEATALLRISVASSDATVVGRSFSSAVVETGLSSYPGLYMGAPPGPAKPFARYLPALVPASTCDAIAWVGAERDVIPSVAVQHGRTPAPVPIERPQVGRSMDDLVRVPLEQLVGTRSGDKGGNANLGIWARDDRTHDWLAATINEAMIRTLIPGIEDLAVAIYKFPNLRAVNIVIEGFLGFGTSSCLRFDRQAKGLGEFLRARYVDVPRALLSSSGGNSA
jgi:hypothetical protein